MVVSVARRKKREGAEVFETILKGKEEGKRREGQSGNR